MIREDLAVDKNQITIMLLVAMLSVFLAVPHSIAQTKSFHKALQLEKHGEFQKAASLLEAALDENAAMLSPSEKSKITFEIERMRRIRIDYSLTAGDLFAQLERSVKGITRPEFDRWIRQHRFDARVINDTLRFVSASRSNLFFRYPAIAARRMPPADEHNYHTAILDDCESIAAAADSARAPYVSPKRFKIDMTITVDSGAVARGDMVKAWLPIPHAFPYQKDFQLLASSSKPLAIAPGDCPIRSVCMEQPADSDGGEEFTIEYIYETFGVHFNLDPDKVAPYNRQDSLYREFTSEAPNIIFTNKIKTLSAKIVGGETNPLIKARMIYDWIAHNIKYSFAREYSTINNISNYCLTHRYGDCGQEAMLFITLCRYNGIPARWQSGWFIFPGGEDIHDWTQIYVAPYGWVPVDPYMGILATRYMTDMTESQRKEVRRFYFGGLDQYRMSANSGNNQKLTPPKKYFRSDNVDFQRAELESATGNIYFNRFRYGFHVQEENAPVSER